MMHRHVDFFAAFLRFISEQGGSLYFQSFPFVGNAFDQFWQLSFRKWLFEGYVVAFYDEARGVHELVREVSVVGENEQAFAVLV